MERTLALSSQRVYLEGSKPISRYLITWAATEGSLHDLESLY